jgi:hypothetical protein
MNFQKKKKTWAHSSSFRQLRRRCYSTTGRDAWAVRGRCWMRTLPPRETAESALLTSIIDSIIKRKRKESLVQ